ncbi:MAG: trimeric intracellular cation channel family protein [Hyphomicrobiaceae bacterium]|nr:trimeric intracellular cation channel family protein [Hyphomicrobiaceae bacterium]MCC0009115.1 trimeric intracellular cation channel family protein [Hyphomicrobiaceae bacterium]
MPFEQVFTSFIAALDAIAVGVFAVTGALVASRKEMDIFGFALLGTVTGVGGGTVRDVLLGHLPVFWIKSPVYAAIALAVSAVVFFTAHIPESRYRLLLWLDAIGLSLVAVIGADRGLDADVGAFIAIVMGVITAVFGGIIRDVLGGESPVILRREIYVIPAMIGALTFVLMRGHGVDYPPAAIAGFASCFTVRGLALYYGWSLPAYRARPGRVPVDAAPEPEAAAKQRSEPKP